VDTYDGALQEAGDLLVPIKNGTIDRSHIIADLHEIAAKKKTGRFHRDDITLFKSVGCALEDLIVALAACVQCGRERLNELSARPLKGSL
jgi:ornithine cyclodeaminase/alanine dehydrogenase-like protein (mu-crystallin family)